MGYIIERANILDRLFNAIQLAIGWMPGSLAIATLATCAIFATATGIVGAVVTLMGLLAFPAMLRAGYDTRLSAGVVCAGGCLGILIPPSVMLILYGATAGVSVPKLYAAALFPGLMLAGFYMIYVLIRCMLNPSLAPRLPVEQRSPAVRYERFLSSESGSLTSMAAEDPALDPQLLTIQAESARRMAACGKAARNTAS
jgi:TRAP-type mannitol/chloroaromatic compound transport system permease large subunit